MCDQEVLLVRLCNSYHDMNIGMEGGGKLAFINSEKPVYLPGICHERIYFFLNACGVLPVKLLNCLEKYDIFGKPLNKAISLILF
jgi:hypothetical protein